jgi:hypothetical protein
MPNGGPELTNDSNHTSKSRLVVLGCVRVGTSYNGMLLTRLGWFKKAPSAIQAEGRREAKKSTDY